MCNKAYIDTGNLKVHHLVYSGDHQCLCDVCNKTFSHKCVPMRCILSYYYKDPKSFDKCKSFFMVRCIQNHHSLQMSFLRLSLYLSRKFKNFFCCLRWCNFMLGQLHSFQVIKVHFVGFWVLMYFRCLQMKDCWCVNCVFVNTRKTCPPHLPHRNVFYKPKKNFILCTWSVCSVMQWWKFVFQADGCVRWI